MPDTYSKIYIQLIFAVKHRNALIDSMWEERLYQYITGIVQNKEQKMIAINGVTNHIHLFIGMRPNCCLSNLVREIKKSSNDFVNINQFTRGKFDWQEGFGAFSYGHSQIAAVANYVINQKEHHKKRTFKEEYLQFLTKYKIDHDEKHMFMWIE